MNLPERPAECWTLISGQLSSHNFSRLVSKSLHAILNPYLYRRIDLSVHNIAPNVKEAGEQQQIAPCLPRLLK